jgi:hypothetical protein
MRATRTKTKACIATAIFLLLGMTTAGTSAANPVSDIQVIVGSQDVCSTTDETLTSRVRFVGGAGSLGDYASDDRLCTYSPFDVATELFYIGKVCLLEDSWCWEPRYCGRTEDEFDAVYRNGVDAARGRPAAAPPLGGSPTPAIPPLYKLTEGDDLYFGDDGVDWINGLGGDDCIFTYGGNDVVAGGPGNDVIYLGDGIDTGYGGEGNDRLYQQADGGHLDGDAGDDRLFGGNGKDLIRGGDGDDRIWGYGDDDTLCGDNEFPSWVDYCEGSWGPESGRDIIYGGKGNDVLWGGDGDDELYGGKGDDDLFGANGFDYANGGEDLDNCDAESVSIYWCP